LTAGRPSLTGVTHHTNEPGTGPQRIQPALHFPFVLVFIFTESQNVSCGEKKKERERKKENIFLSSVAGLRATQRLRERRRRSVCVTR